MSNELFLFGWSGTLILGFLIGVYSHRHLQRWISRQVVHGRGPCALCGESGFLFQCQRCRRRVAMCHSYHVLLTAPCDPAKLAPRPSWDICSECVREREREVLEGPMRE